LVGAMLVWLSRAAPARSLMLGAFAPSTAKQGYGPRGRGGRDPGDRSSARRAEEPRARWRSPRQGSPSLLALRPAIAPALDVWRRGAPPRCGVPHSTRGRRVEPITLRER